jgi:hypothetical protein
LPELCTLAFLKRAYTEKATIGVLWNYGIKEL